MDIINGTEATPEIIVSHDLALNMDVWYPNKLLQKHTMPTLVVNLTVNELQTIEFVGKLVQNEMIFDKEDLQQKIQSEERLLPLQSVCDRVSESIESLGGSCFFKMSTRSAKDVVFEKPNPEVMKPLRRALEEYAEENATEGEVTESQRMSAAYFALKSLISSGNMAFKKTTAIDVLWDLLSSTRCLPDISRVLALRDSCKDDRFTKMEIILRKWVTLPQTSEFRVFCRDATVVAISQYDHLVYAPEILNDRSDLIREIISGFIDKVIKPQIGADNGLAVSSFIADLAIVNIEDPLLEPSNAQVVLIEFNPYLSITSACLFSWKTDAVLTTGEDAVAEVRCVSKPVDAITSVQQLAPCYRTVIAEWLDYFF
eukprot:TRINITY_DN6422_c4_g1_i1.p1 TRINITY_DN6422_c4_g1~~TRINITY_DN6422_c4_g1_i1.p1  ORF type:complete len:371 (+),score=57.78 TRINITY_DN6422_c4_g1_i1:53-1165(+)